MNGHITKVMNFSVPVLCMTILLRLHISQANDCGKKPAKCPLEHKNCYCRNGRPVEIFCKNGKWLPKPCGATENPTTISTTPPPTTQEITCPRLGYLPFVEIEYSNASTTLDGYPLHTQVIYTCLTSNNGKLVKKLQCEENGWVPEKLPVCSCTRRSLMEGPNEKIDPQPACKSGQCQIGTVAAYSCNNGNTLKKRAKCVENQRWISLGNYESCLVIPTKGNTIKQTKKVYRKTTSKSPPSVIHHSEERTVVIVSGTTGAILGALIILVVIVSCQRRLHYHRMRRARLRHRQDQEAFTAFITYHRDVRLMLPSYDEAMTQQEHGQPPSYEDPTLPRGHTPEGDNPPSISTDSPLSSNSPGSETRNSPESRSRTENDSDTDLLINRQSLVSPASENSRFFRSLRALFGGRSFRPDAIYCRFVPEEDGSESQARGEARESRDTSTSEGGGRVDNNSTGEDDLADVLALSGFD